MSEWGRKNTFNCSYQTPNPGASCAGNRVVNVGLGLEVVFRPLGTTPEIKIIFIVMVWI